MDATPQLRGEEPGTGLIARRRVYRAAFQVLGTGTFLLLVLIGFSFASRHFLTYSNTLNVLSNVTVIGIVSLGQALTIISGGFDLSVSGTVPLGAVVFTLAVNAGIPVGLAIVGVAIAGSFVGLINGLIITRLKINPLITTLGTMSIGVGLAYTLSNGVTIPFADPDHTGVLADKAFGDVAWYLIAFLLLTVVLFLVSRFTVFGRDAVRGRRQPRGEPARRHARRSDHGRRLHAVLGARDLRRHGGRVPVACGFGDGGRRCGAVLDRPRSVLGGASLTGGVGGIPGTLIGVLILGTIANGMALLQVPAFYQQIATGLILLLGVGFARLREVLSGEQS